MSDTNSEDTSVPIHKFKEDAKINEFFSWEGIGGYKIENGKYIIEIRGNLKRGRFINKLTTIQKKDGNNWKVLSLDSIHSDRGKVLIYEVPNFSYNFILSQGQYKLHTAVYIDEETYEYDFEFETSNKWKPPPPPATSIYLCSACFYLSGGLNYLNYRQSPPTDLKPINYISTKIASFAFESRWSLGRKSGLRLEFHSQKGADLSQTSNFENKKIQWTYLTLGADKILNSNGKFLNVSFSNGFLYGIQIHQMPFLLQSVNGSYTIDTLKFYSLGGGGFTGIKFYNSELIALMRFQIGVAGPGTIKLTSGFSFDGSINYLSSINKNTFWGITWGGQFHSYNYKLTDKTTENNITGTYSMIVSNIALALGMQF